MLGTYFKTHCTVSIVCYSNVIDYYWLQHINITKFNLFCWQSLTCARILYQRNYAFKLKSKLKYLGIFIYEAREL